MRLVLAGTAAAVFAFAATPAFAQYGGSPDQQVDGAPAPNAAQAAPEVEDEDAGVATPYGVESPEAYGDGDVAVAEDGPSGPDADAAVDPDIDADAEVGKGDADTDVDADAAVSADQAGVDADADADVDQDVDADAEDMSGDVDSDQGYEDQDSEPGSR